MPLGAIHTYPRRNSKVLNVLSTAGASILALGYLLPISYLTWSMRYAESPDKEPLARHWPGVENGFTAAHGKF